MCYDDDARPPYPPIAGASGRGEDLVLTSTNGTRLAAFAAEPERAATTQVLIYPDVRGLHTFYKELALRFAEVGTAALAIDYFGRTAGLTARDDKFEYMPHVEQMKLADVLDDTRTGLSFLRQGGGAKRATFILGFCRGGSLSLYAAAEPLGLGGIVAFYAGLGRKLDPERGTPIDDARRSRCAVLGLFGGADAGIPPEQVQALDLALDESGQPHDIVTYPGAPHSFFDRRTTEYADASADAWRRVLGFMAAGVPA